MHEKRIELTSIKEPHVVLCRELTTAVGRRAHRKILLVGEQQISWAREYGLVIEFIILQKGVDIPGVLHYTKQVFEASEGILKKASEMSHAVPCIGVAFMSPLDAHEDPDFVVVLDHVVDPGNIGTIVRTANSFGIRRFIATSPTFDPYNKKVIEASRGSTFHSAFRWCESPAQTADMLRDRGYQIVVTSPHARHLQSQTPLSKKPIALIVGNETHGVSEELSSKADLSIQIPMLPPVESLNVGVATGISLYELKFKMILLTLKEKIFENFGRRINVTSKLIQLSLDKIVKKASDFSGQQVILLMIMHCDQEMTRKEIERDMGLFGADLDEFLSPLIKCRYIDHNDLNVWSVTDGGERFLAEIWPIVEKANEQILGDLSLEDRRKLDDMLRKIQSACVRIIGDSLS